MALCGTLRVTKIFPPTPIALFLPFKPDKLGDLSILTKLTHFFSARQQPAFLVGGYLRDSLLVGESGKSPLRPKDLDIAVPGDPQPLARELAEVMEGAFVALSPARGVARVVVPQHNGGALALQGQASVGLKAEHTIHGPWVIDLAGFWGDIEEDLARRDFTINALALPWQHWLSPDWRQLVLDPFNGRGDLARRCIRAVTPDVFQDDPGRLLRAVRLAARLHFQLEPETARLVRADASRIAQVSGERVRDEFLAILSQDGARGQLEVLDRLDLLCRIIPELALTKGVEQPKEHYWDVWGHLLHTVEAAELVTKGHQNSATYTPIPWTVEMADYFNQEVSDGHTRRMVLKLAGLFHDIAKPQTKKKDETGRTRFLGHSELGATMAASRLAHLRLSSRGIHMVTTLVEQHLRPNHMKQGVALPTGRAIYRYFRDLDDVAIDGLYLSLADYLAAKGPKLALDDWAEHVKMVTYILQVGTQQPAPDRVDRLLTGHDLMRHFDLTPGPQIGFLLEKVNEARAAGEITTREEALALVAAVLDTNS